MNKKNGFTLIELLVVISIMGILLALSVFGMQNARKASRDGKRKADLEQIRSALEMYKADCGAYPLTSALVLKSATTLTGNGDDCSSSNIYISTIPTDPVSTTSNYYYSSNGDTYVLCASLEQGSGSVGCGGSTTSCGTACNYKVKSP